MRSARLLSFGWAFFAWGLGCVPCWGATGWAQPAYGVTINTHFSAPGEARSGSTGMTLEHDGAATIQASVASAGDEVLTVSGGDTLVTSYKLTGSALGASADADWVSSSTFISPAKSYSVEGVGPSVITIHVQGAASSVRANDAGSYSAAVILTVTW